MVYDFNVFFFGGGGGLVVTLFSLCNELIVWYELVFMIYLVSICFEWLFEGKYFTSFHQDTMEKYKDVRYLGYGSFGEVWLVENKKTTKLFAMKRIQCGQKVHTFFPSP